MSDPMPRPETGASRPRRFRLQTVGGIGLWAESPDGSVGWQRVEIGEKPCLVLAVVRLAADAEARERVARLLWPEREPARAHNNLRQALFRLRQILGPRSIGLDRAVVRLHCPELVVDVEAVLSPGREPSAGGWLTMTLAELFGEAYTDIGWEYMGWCQTIRRRLRDVLRLSARATTPGWGLAFRAPGFSSHGPSIGDRLRAIWAQRQPGSVTAVHLRRVSRAAAATGIADFCNKACTHETALVHVTAEAAWPPEPLQLERSVLRASQRALLARGGGMDSVPLPLEFAGGATDRSAWRGIHDAFEALASSGPVLTIADGVDAWTASQAELLWHSVTRASQHGAMLVTVGGGVGLPEFPNGVVL